MPTEMISSELVTSNSRSFKSFPGPSYGIIAYAIPRASSKKV